MPNPQSANGFLLSRAKQHQRGKENLSRFLPEEEMNHDRDGDGREPQARNPGM